jgi:alanyl-tRNA synthetase
VIILTEKLYDINSYLTEFEAEVISCEKADDFYKIILNKTAFFPEEGGQYSDKGKLNDADVFDVQIENGEIVHYCSKSLNGKVFGTINFERRFRNMQNHTGEHVISGLIHSLFGGENVGFHLGEDEVTCDYDIELNEEQLSKVELLANEAVYKNLAVTGYYPNEIELKNISYRSKKEINEAIRIVDIDGVDRCACCAPHVKTTAEIGVIKILSSMKLRSGVRLFIACGKDAYLDYAAKHSQIKAVGALLASKGEECAENVERLIKSNKEAVYKINTLLTKINEIKLYGIEKTDKTLLLFTSCTDKKQLIDLVNKAKEKSGNMCAAFGGDDTLGYTYIIYSEEEILTDFVKNMNSVLSGRGGGRVPMCQGSVTSSQKEITDYFANAQIINL